MSGWYCLAWFPALIDSDQPRYPELTLISAVGGMLICLGFVATAQVWAWASALQWLVQAGLLWWLVIHATTSRLGLNRADSKSVNYSNLGWANRLTILRGLLIAMTGGYLFQDWPPGLLVWLPGILYTLAAVIDRLDGYVARKSGQTSLLGVELDTVFDALGLAVAPLLAVCYGQIHWSYLLFSSAYYLFQWGMYRRKLQGLPVHKLPPNIMRRAWAGFQMGFIGVVLFPLFTPPLTTVAGFAFMLPVLIGFCIDWLVVSGQIDRQNVVTQKWFARAWGFNQAVMQPLLRLIVVLVVLLLIGQSDSQPEFVMLIPALMVLTGMAGRIGALILIGLFGIYYLNHSFNMTGYVLVIGLVWILLLGSGRYSLWQGDEAWVNRYDGA